MTSGNFFSFCICVLLQEICCYGIFEVFLSHFFFACFFNFGHFAFPFLFCVLFQTTDEDPSGLKDY